MDKKTTHKFSVTLSDRTFENLKKLAASKHITQSELIRRLVNKGLSLESYANEQDLIQGYIREAVDASIGNSTDRLIRLQLKATQSAAICMYACISVLSDSCADEADFENLLANAIRQAHIYMKQKELPFEDYVSQAKKFHGFAREIKNINDM
ncbi:MAG: ribbon-helix-helix protein, CopG family [Oscillospiraceae bacterium]|nr:ribbon-helix-helix protein, CopG family [Oscillospiraceae bacterium]